MKKVKRYSYLIIFLLIVVGLGVASFRKLVNFYINQEKDYNEWTPELGRKFETDITSTFYEKFSFVNLNGAISNALNQPSMNGQFKLKNGHLISPQARMTDEEIESYANEVIKYADFCRSQRKPFLFVQPILKVDEDNKQLPSGVEDYSNENIDYFLDCLRNAEIDVLDIRQCMKADGMDIYDYTYITDHHWTTIGCFYAFEKITEWIEKETGTVVNPTVTDLNQYDIITYPKWHLGSYGQRTGAYYAGIDDYELIVPKFDVLFLNEDGNFYSFYESAVNPEIFEKLDVTSRYTYDNALHCPNGVSSTSQKFSVLFVSDSYATAMAPYLKMAYSDYYSWYYPSGLNAEYINQTNPDVVVLMPFYTSIFSSGAVFN